MAFEKIAACLVFVLTASAANAENCQLKQLASLEVIATDDGLIVPVTLENQTGGYMTLDLANSVSVLNEATVRRFDLHRQSIDQNVTVIIDGTQLHQKAEANVQLGGSKGNAWIGIMPDYKTSDPRVVGILGMDILNQFDIELDLGHDKVNLFSHDHCKGQVIYWTRTAPVAAVPMTFRGNMEFVIPMTLDNKQVNAEISTGPRAVLNGNIAHDLFGLENANGEHTFDMISVDGLGITHPKLGIYKDDTAGCNGGATLRDVPLLTERNPDFQRCYGRADLFLGLSQLKHLRVFLAYKERMMYATAANAN